MRLEAEEEKPLRVLHIGKYFPPHPGGMETYLRDLMNVQKRQGLDVQALVHSSEPRLFDAVESVDEPSGLSYQVTRCARWFNLGFVPISPLFWLSALIAIRRFQPTIIHIHHPNASAAWLLFLIRARKIPWVAHWQSDIETPESNGLFKTLYKIYRPIEQAILKKTARIIATSPTYLAHSTGLKRHTTKCAVIPLGLDPRRLPTASEVAEVSRPQQPLILFVGRLAAYKGLQILIKAVADLPEAHCWVAGDGNLRQELEIAIQRHGLSERVTLLGAVDEEQKWRLYKACDLVVLPSTEKTEAFGMVLLEAAHFGKPVVVTDVVGSGVTWVADQLAGRIATANDPASLSAEIAGLVEELSTQDDGRAFTYPEALSLPNQSLQLSKQYQYSLASSVDSWTPVS